MAWTRLGENTLTTTGDEINVTGVSASKYNMILTHGVGSGDSRLAVRLGTDSFQSSGYSERNSENFATDNTGSSRGYYYYLYNGYNNQFTVHYTLNIDGEDKHFISQTVQATATGTSVTTHTIGVGKSTHSSQWNQIQAINYGGGDMLTGSNSTVLGTD